MHWTEVLDPALATCVKSTSRTRSMPTFVSRGDTDTRYRTRDVLRFTTSKQVDCHTMSFRRKRDEWDEFLSRNRDAIMKCGVPDIVIRDKLRFLVFLDHGYDELGWAENNHAFFHSKVMTDDQIDRLAKLVGENIDQRYLRIIASRWTRNE